MNFHQRVGLLGVWIQGLALSNLKNLTVTRQGDIRCYFCSVQTNMWQTRADVFPAGLCRVFPLMPPELIGEYYMMQLLGGDGCPCSMKETGLVLVQDFTVKVSPKHCCVPLVLLGLLWAKQRSGPPLSSRLLWIIAWEISKSICGLRR